MNEEEYQAKKRELLNLLPDFRQALDQMESSIPLENRESTIGVLLEIALQVHKNSQNATEDPAYHPKAPMTPEDIMQLGNWDTTGNQSAKKAPAKITRIQPSAMPYQGSSGAGPSLAAAYSPFPGASSHYGTPGAGPSTAPSTATSSTGGAASYYGTPGAGPSTATTPATAASPRGVQATPYGTPGAGPSTARNQGVVPPVPVSHAAVTAADWARIAELEGLDGAEAIVQGMHLSTDDVILNLICEDMDDLDQELDED